MNEIINWENTYKALDEYGQAVEDLYKQKLINADHVASHKLIESVKHRLIVGNQSIELVLDLEDYWKYIENGAKAHWPPIGPRPDGRSIMDWLTAKNLPVRPYNGKLPTMKQLAFLIARAIAGESPNQKNLKNPEGGMKAEHLLDQTLEELNIEYEEIISQAIAKDLDYGINMLLVKSLWT